MTDYQQHPLSAAFPAMTPEMFGELRADIVANGLRSPIILFDGRVLDGWHRHRACQQTGTEARYEPFAGDEAAARKLVVSANLMRRHLDTSQRAMIAARFATQAHGSNQHISKGRGERISAVLSVDSAAALVNVGKDVVKDARTVLAKATPETIAKVDRGELSVSRAAKEVRASTPAPARQPALPKPSPSQSSLITLPTIEIAPQTVDEWTKLPEAVRRVHLEHRNSKAQLNQQKPGEDDNAIDWANWTWNPVTGCLHSCPYCYARDIANRFSGTSPFPNGFIPTLRADRLAAPLNGTPRASDDPRDRRIFTGSMTDLFGRWVPREWIETVLSVARQASQWEFLMLTKFPKRMSEFDIPPNVWMGTSVDCQARVAAAEAAFENVSAKVRWISCEPMIEPLRFKHLDRFDLVVIGGASPSNQTPRWIPPFEWIADLMRQADAAGCGVFLKSNLYRKEQPHGGARYKFTDRAPEVFHYLARASAPDQQVNAA